MKESSNHEDFIIESRFGQIENFTNLHRIIDRSNIKAIYDIIQGTEFVPSKEQINRLNYSQLTGKLIIGKLLEFIGGCPIISDKFIGSDIIIG